MFSDFIAEAKEKVASGDLQLGVLHDDDEDDHPEPLLIGLDDEDEYLDVDSMPDQPVRRLEPKPAAPPADICLGAEVKDLLASLHYANTVMHYVGLGQRV